MSQELEDLKSRIDALENFSVKHFTKLYVAVEPAGAKPMLDDMASIYSRTPRTKAKGDTPPDPHAAMAGIYSHHSSPKR